MADIIKNLPAMQETWDSVPGLGRSPGKGNSNPLQHSHLGNPVDREEADGLWSMGSQRVGHDPVTDSMAAILSSGNPHLTAPPTLSPPVRL